MTQSRTIASVIPDINTDTYLPAIQREFVWDKKQIEKLFDSVARGYPIGSLLFWKVNGDFAEDQVKYEFMQDYIDEPNYPDEIEGVRHHNKKVDPKYENTPNKVSFVLDGQQRLTAFYIGLKGSYTERRLNHHRRLAKNWNRKLLYLNLFNDPETEVDSQHNLHYEFRFKEPEPAQTENNYWYKVSDILDADEMFPEYKRVCNDIEDELGHDNFPTDPVLENINTLYSTIHEEETINYDEQTTEDEEKVLDIFIRVNEGGTQLSKPDMVLSVMTASWADDTTPGKNIVAREHVLELCDELNNHPACGGDSIDVRFILRCLLACSGLPQSFSFSNFNNEANLSKMKRVWDEEKFHTALRKTLDLLESFGLSTYDIQSLTPLIPVVNFFYVNDNPTLRYYNKEQKRTRQKLLYWITSTVLTKAYASSTPQILRSLVNELDGGSDVEFPMVPLTGVLSRYGEGIEFDETHLSETINRLERGEHKTRVLLSLLYFPMPANGNKKLEVDHLFPKSQLDADTLVEEHGIKKWRAKKFEARRDDIGNLQLLQKGENRTKSDTLFSDWIADQTEEYRQDHFIPEDASTFKVENFLEFVEKREELMKEHLLRENQIIREHESVPSSILPEQAVTRSAGD